MASRPTSPTIKFKSRSHILISPDGQQCDFTWYVEDELFGKFLEAAPGVGFESADFKFSEGIWRLKCYPNGTKKYGQGNVSLFLAVMKLPPHTVQFGVQYEFECKEVNYRDEYGSELTNIFNKKHSSWGYPETFKRNLLMNLQKKNSTKLTIQCRMKKVLAVSIVSMSVPSPSSTPFDQGNNVNNGSTSDFDVESLSENNVRINKCSHFVTWFIDPLTTQSFTNSASKQPVDSTAFQLYRSKWCLQCYPNGDKYANGGMVSLYLKLLEFPESSAYHIRNMKVRMQFECGEIQYQSNEFLHTYENKKQEVYFGISSAFKTFQLNYLSQNVGISIKCRIDLVSVSIDGEKWWQCIRERDALKNKAKRAEHEAKEQNKKLETSYTCHKVVSMKEVQPRVRDKIKRLIDESQSILRHHERVLAEWSATTKQLNAVIASNCDINVLRKPDDHNDANCNMHSNEQPQISKAVQSDNNNNEEGKNQPIANEVAEKKERSIDIEADEEEEDDLESTGYALLEDYRQCLAVMDEQNNRLEQVSKNVVSLLSKQATFLQSIAEWKEKEISGKSEFTQLLQQYNEIKFERMKLQDEMAQKVEQCNKKIDDENALNKKKCNKENELNAMHLEMKQFELMSKECKQLIEEYNEFVQQNSENIRTLNKHLRAKWNEFEQSWFQWNAKDIMAFIHYKMQWICNGVQLLNMDLQHIEANMVKQDICGLSLKTLDKADLYSLGFTNYQLRCRIFDHIRMLRAKYPAPKLVLGTSSRLSALTPTAGSANGSRKELDISDDAQQTYTVLDDDHKAYPANNANGKHHRSDSDSSNASTTGGNIIPSKFVCPITKNLMSDPVMAFDGYTYERTAIAQYLHKHRKSPKTGKEAHTLCLFPNLQLQQEIDAFRIVNDILVEPGDHDGDEEITSFVD